MKHSDYIRRFLAEGKTEQEYYAWSRLCGIKASHSYKDSLLRERFDVQSVSEFGTWPPIDELNLQSLEELNHYILFECRNPADLAMCYLELLRTQPDDHTLEGFLNDNLRPFPRKSFLRFGDKNWLPDVSPGWFKADGIPIDVQAMELSEGFGHEISPDDIVTFVTTFRKGAYRPAHEQMIRAYEDTWYELCGFRLTEKYAEHLGKETGLLTDQQPQPEILEEAPF